MIKAQRHKGTEAQRAHLIAAVCLVMTIVALGAALAGCQAAPSAEEQQLRARQLVDDLNSARKGLDAAKAGAAAATRPVVIPGNREQGIGDRVVPAAPEVVKASAAATQAIAKLETVVAAAEKIAAAATQPGATPESVGTTAVTTIVPFLPPQAQGYAGLAILAISIAGNVLQSIQKRKEAEAKAKALDAAQKNVDAINAAIANGQITVTPTAARAADAVVADHPVGDRLVDALTATTTPTRP
jgi:hypothetical protein